QGNARLPIPNPEAKPARADGTAPGRVWESKLPPTIKQNTTKYDKDPSRHTRLHGSFRRFTIFLAVANSNSYGLSVRADIAGEIGLLPDSATRYRRVDLQG